MIGGVNEADFKCLIFVSMHATFDHAICVTLVLHREGKGVRMTNKETERCGEIKPRGEKREVSIGTMKRAHLIKREEQPLWATVL